MSDIEKINEKCCGNGEGCGCHEEIKENVSCGCGECDCESHNSQDFTKESERPLSETDTKLYNAASAILYASEELKSLNSMMSLTLVSIADSILKHTEIDLNNNQNKPVLSEKVIKEVDDLVNEFCSSENLLD